jgi:uncharacterized protein (DUF433 family)
MSDFAADAWNDFRESEEVIDLADQMLPDAPLRDWRRSLAKVRNEYVVVPTFGMHDDDDPNDMLNAAVAVSPDVLLSMRLTFAAHMLKEVVEIDPDKAGGAPVLTGTRFKISRIFGELADGVTISKLAKEYHLDKTKIQKLLQGIAIKLDRPFLSD